MLDERQYRAPQACPRPARRGANRVNDCAELFDPERSKLGARQEQWLAAELASSKAQWTLLAQGTVTAYVDEQPVPGERFWTDGWNRYPVARDRLLDTLATTRVANPIFLSSDIHAFLIATWIGGRRAWAHRSSRVSSRRPRSAPRAWRKRPWRNACR